MEMERGKIDMAKDILAIDSPVIYNKVRKVLTDIFAHKASRRGETISKTEYAKTLAFLDQFAGQWQDSRTADEMVEDIYQSRYDKDNSEVVEILNQ